MHNRFHILITILSLLVLLAAGCDSNSSGTVKLGFIACLSGKQCDLGHSGRDGVVLAIEEINTNGGVVAADGMTYKLELLDADIAGEENSVNKTLSALAKQQVVAYLGPMLSQKALQIHPLANQLKIPMIAPTVSTHHLSQKNDYFFRVYPTCNITAPALAHYAIKKEHIGDISIIYDPKNKIFSKGWIEHFSEEIERAGGQIHHIYPIDYVESKKELVTEALKRNPDGLLCILNAVDTAMIIQQAKLFDPDIKILGTEWSTTESLTGLAGHSLEGAAFVASFDEDGQQKRFLDFENKYIERFGHKATFSGRYGYEAVQVLRQAMEHTSDFTKLRDALKQLGKVEVLQGDITLDDYGDVLRDIFIQKYIDGKFRVVDRVAIVE